MLQSSIGYKHALCIRNRDSKLRSRWSNQRHTDEVSCALPASEVGKSLILGKKVQVATKVIMQPKVEVMWNFLRHHTSHAVKRFVSWQNCL